MARKLLVLSLNLAILMILGACSGGGGGSGSTGGAFTPPTGGGGGGGGGTTNNPPVITSSAPTAATEAQLYSYQAAATDADGDSLTWSLTVSPTGMTINTSGLVNWTPTTAQVGSHNVTIDVNDGTVSASQSWNITVTAASGGGGGGGSPSNGSGGAFPGNQTRSVTVSGLGAQTYYLYIPNSYNPSTAVPVMFAFHGAGGNGTSPAAAQAARSDWASVANSGNFIVVAQASTGSGGGWVPSNDVAILNDVITDVLGAYNIEQQRIYAWGFSAGGHLIHGVALQNSAFFAAYGVSAGALQALAGTGAPAAATRKIPVDLHIGNADSVVPPSAVQSDRNNFQASGWTLGTNLWYTEFNGGHTYSTTHLSEIWNNLKSHSLP